MITAIHAIQNGKISKRAFSLKIYSEGDEYFTGKDMENAAARLYQLLPYFPTAFLSFVHRSARVRHRFNTISSSEASPEH